MKSEQTRWIDINDREPEDQQEVIIHIGWLPPCFNNVAVAWYEKSKKLFYTDSPDIDEIHRGFVAQALVEHWMPIPML